MRTCLPFLAVCAVLVFVAPASAQSSDGYMRHECERSAQAYFRDLEAGTNTKVSRRNNRTYSVDGQIFLESATRNFACSFSSDGRTMAQFSADGRVDNGYLPGVGSSRQVRVRLGRGSSESVLTASVAAGHSVRYVLNARARQNLYTRIDGSGLSYRILNLGLPRFRRQSSYTVSPGPSCPLLPSFMNGGAGAEPLLSPFLCLSSNASGLW